MPLGNITRKVEAEQCGSSFIPNCIQSISVWGQLSTSLSVRFTSTSMCMHIYIQKQPHKRKPSFQGQEGIFTPLIVLVSSMASTRLYLLRLFSQDALLPTALLF